MANIQSSKKSIRKTAKLTARNKAEKSRLRTFSKKLQKAKGENDVVATKAAAIELMSFVDKAKKHGVLHANKANRMKSRLTPLIAAVSAEKPAQVAQEEPASVAAN